MKESLHVLMLSKDSQLLYESSDVSGGTRGRHIYYAQRLRERYPGSELRVVVMNARNLKPQEQQPVPGLRLYPTSSARRTFFFWHALRTIPRVLADGWKPNVITGQEPWEEGVLALLAKARLRARAIPQLHFNLFSLEWRRESLWNELKYLLARWVLRRSDRIRVVSNPLKDAVASTWRVAQERIYVAPVGVHFDAVAPEEKRCNRSPTVLFVGRLCRQKNLQLWLRVAKMVHDNRPDVKFCWVGTGQDEQPLKQLAADLGLSASFTWLGAQRHQDLPRIYAAADLFLLTSDYEGFGRVVLEAMLAGLPVVSTLSSGPQDLIEHGVSGFLTPLGDAQGLSDAVLRLVSDPELAERFGRAGRNIALSRFSLPVLTDRMIDGWAQ